MTPEEHAILELAADLKLAKKEIADLRYTVKFLLDYNKELLAQIPSSNPWEASCDE